jgi:hypothetical protein
MAETKSDQNEEKKPESVKSGGGPAKTTQSKSKTTKTGQSSRGGAAKAGKAAKELGEGIKDTVDKEITPAADRATRRVVDTTRQVRKDLGSAAEKAKKGLSDTTRQVRKDLGSAAGKAKKGLSDTSRKVREELRPAAEKARKGLSDTSKKVREELGPAAEKAGKGLSSLFKSTARATRKSARILGIKASIAAEMRKRQKLLADLGERYFQVQKKKTPSQGDKDALDALVGEVKKVDAEIHTLELKEKATREST